MDLKAIHIGKEIQKRFEDSKLTKAAFAKLLDIPSQNVNRIFSKDTIETSRLIDVSNALNFNFFSLFTSDNQINISTQGDFSPASEDSDVTMIVGDAVLAERIKAKDAIIEEKNERIKELKERIEELKHKQS